MKIHRLVNPPLEGGRGGVLKVSELQSLRNLSNKFNNTADIIDWYKWNILLQQSPDLLTYASKIIF